MEIGQLKNRIDLIAAVRVDDGAGGATRADTVVMTVWGNVAIASSSQSQRAERLEQRVSHTITVRWRRDLALNFKTGGRARYKDKAGATRELSVQTIVDPNGRGDILQLGCLEGGPT